MIMYNWSQDEIHSFYRMGPNHSKAWVLFLFYLYVIHEHNHLW